MVVDSSVEESKVVRMDLDSTVGAERQAGLEGVEERGFQVG